MKKETKNADGFVEIPFGAFDSETIGWTYTIPEGFTAKIESGKIIVEKAESDDEEIRKWLIGYMKDEIDGDEFTPEGVKKANKAIAWLEKQKDVETEIEKAYKNADKIQYEKGFEDGVASVKPVEWSEEDEKMLKDVYESLYAYQCDIRAGMMDKNALELLKDVDKEKAWLKSLRPQPHWKPSEEQMKALKYVAYHLMPDENYREEMFSLYNELKKL